MRAEEFVSEKWSKKYKRSIDCSNPKGFSQRAHCAGRKLKEFAPSPDATGIMEARVPHSIEEFLDSLSPDDVGVEEFGRYRVHYEGFTDDCQSSRDYRQNPDAVYDQVFADFIAREGGRKPLVQDMVGDERYPILYSIFKIPQQVKEFAPSPERDNNDDVPDPIFVLANRWWNATDLQPQIEHVLNSLGWSIHQVESEDDAVQLQHRDGTTHFISADEFDPDLHEQQLDELMFKGSQCTKDCSGHRAGYEWSARKGNRTANSWSQSFNNGAAIRNAGR
jgi:hypothetical protein